MAPAAGLISTRRQCEGVPDIWVTPAEPARASRIASGSVALVSSIEPPPRRARSRIWRPTIPAHVVERAPNRAVRDGEAVVQRPAQACQVVEHHLRRAVVPEVNSTHSVSRPRAAGKGRPGQVGPAAEARQVCNRQRGRGAVRHHRVRLGLRRDGGELLRGEIGKAEENAAGHPVERDKCQHGR